MAQLLRVVIVCICFINLIAANSISHIFYDFDETISANHMFSILAQKGGYTNDEQVNALSNNCDEWCIADIFGGKERINALNEHLNLLKSKGIHLGLISFGFKDAIVLALKKVGLLSYFDDIFGRKAMSFKKMRRPKTKALKAILIRKHFQDVPPTEILFVDNDERNMRFVEKQGVANIFNDGPIVNGLTPVQMQWIASLCDDEQTTES